MADGYNQEYIRPNLRIKDHSRRDHSSYQFNAVPHVLGNSEEAIENHVTYLREKKVTKGGEEEMKKFVFVLYS